MGLGFADESPERSSDRAPSPITLRTRIPLPGVYGRMDHYGWDSKRGILIVAALGNNTVEIVDSWKRVRTITCLEHPQAAVYVPGLDRIVVSTQSGKLRFYDAETYALLDTLDFGANADTDNMRYDAASKRLYVGYGRGSHGALAIVDPARMERLREFELSSHPESFQLETSGSRIFVNLPDQEAIGVIDRKTGAVTKWKIPGHSNTHAMALDEVSHRLFTAACSPDGLSWWTATLARWSPVSHACSASTTYGSMPPESEFMLRGPGRSTCSNSSMPTIMSRSRMSPLRPEPAARASISRPARRTVCSCRCPTCFPKAGRRCCSSM
jgi:hypothetical protein